MREDSERVIRERIEATRGRMGHTIEQIGDRVNPDRVKHELKARAREQVDELKDSAKRKVRNTMDDARHEIRDTGHGIWETVRENPLPAGMVGVGLAWLVANGARGSDARRQRAEPYGNGHRSGANRYRPVPSASYGDAAHDVEGRSGGAYVGASIHRYPDDEGGGIRERGEEMLDDAREKGREALESARDTGRDAMDAAREGIHDARDKARHWAEDAGHQVQRAERRVEDRVRENPLAAGAVAAALGFAAGMMIPESEREREIMGSTRDRAMDRARDTVQRAGEKARYVARETGESAKDAVDEVMSSDGSDDAAVTEPGRS